MDKQYIIQEIYFTIRNTRSLPEWETAEEIYDTLIRIDVLNVSKAVNND